MSYNDFNNPFPPEQYHALGLINTSAQRSIVVRIIIASTACHSQFPSPLRVLLAELSKVEVQAT